MPDDKDKDEKESGSEKKSKNSSKKGSKKQSEDQSAGPQLTFSKQTAVITVLILVAAAGVAYFAFSGSGTQDFETPTQTAPQNTQQNQQAPENPDEVVATVNGEEVTAGDVSQLTAGRQGMSEDQALEQVIDRTLLYLEAVDAGYELSDAEVEQEIQSRLQQRNLTLDQYKQRLQQTGQSYDAWKQQAKRQLAVQNYVQDQVGEPATVSDQEARELYDNLSEQSSQQLPPFEQVKDRLKQRIQQQNQQQAVQQLIERLRQSANISYR